ncbi:mannose-1-phosphate guanylyltransferase/mannose-6-phosphate isomerase [Herbaspirillum sp. Sphag1AN]|uniref:mannose-1-phosphate guanylyltransferase/mannose-6-phosphate isomerase n=1 Tax=unclassified Herbaspirillum TaxID=2624150 RepID=UPI0016158608|nr:MULTISPECIES: mannose-1-phosphate guanylyltransferase/mannose-6-phosphate isomerase [unclassified Herbaspirillum]MBB3211376.1 mannose-1-phosphate guanylyltransferase/mannose-6-phosphate isomerase [Herbaspirillum sp. Sphag1AN]MBB3245357.1 mannose-1-phosphate guanylyltransferase/mannose-6-phosphate isomerase [Herbaspirillum sp. Sphag64]
MISLQQVILSGGSGTRLWPLSREQYPKQLLPLVGNDTMLQATALRLQSDHDAFALAAEPIVVCNEEYRFITAEQLRAVGKASHQIILEPCGRNTAPAVTLAALLAVKGNADPILLVMPADHVIGNVEAFQQAIGAAVPHALGDSIVTFGIVADQPATGYGYIQCGAQLEGAHQIAGFVEKPDVATAQAYIESGDYLWNSGLFMMRASVWLRAIAHFEPDIDRACRAALEGGQQDHDFYRLNRAAFEACPSDSIDYAVMEKLADADALGIDGRIVALDADWSDVGAWDALWDVCEKDAQGNVQRGDVLLEQSSDNLVFAQDRLVAGIGIENLIIVETPDAIMVASKDKISAVKQIVAQLKKSQRGEAVTHRKIYRPWGWYDSIDSGERFQVKRIVVNPGSSLSLQMHHHRAEHWIIVKGTARITRGEEVFLLSENQSTYIPLGVKHRLENPGKFPLEMIEVQSGSYLGEDDIVRFDDTYGRK